MSVAALLGRRELLCQHTQSVEVQSAGLLWAGAGQSCVLSWSPGWRLQWRRHSPVLVLMLRARYVCTVTRLVTVECGTTQQAPVPSVVHMWGHCHATTELPVTNRGKYPVQSWAQQWIEGFIFFWIWICITHQFMVIHISYFIYLFVTWTLQIPIKYTYPSSGVVTLSESWKGAEKGGESHHLGVIWVVALRSTAAVSRLRVSSHCGRICR